MRIFSSSLQIALAVLAAIAVMLADVRLLAVALAVVTALLLTSAGRRTLLLVKSALASLSQRPGSALVIMVGVGAVCATYAGLMSVGHGLDEVMQSTGDTETAIILKQGARSEADSSLSREAIAAVLSADGVARTASGAALASTELAVTAEDAQGHNLHVRGVSPLASKVYSKGKLIDGRSFTAGAHELIAGANLAKQFGGRLLGATVMLNTEPWRIVGVRKAGDAHDTELWGDSATLAATFGRYDYQDVVVRLDSPDGLARLGVWVKANPRLGVAVDTTSDFYSSQSRVFTQVIGGLSTAIAGLLGLGALFALLNTMFTVVEERIREMSTLRAIGFSSRCVTIAFCIEGALIASIGGLVSMGLVWMAMSGRVFSTAGAGLTQIAFVFSLDPSAVLASMRIAVALGIVGSAVPAILSSNRNLIAGLRYA
ncbi:ABC transporter permease [Xanthomonas campestris pv. phormiicola]|nr:ABC transporter permease [Xanthomonas campestris pv. phormiicola]UYC15754.1 ABC transporter permease [Xanthomonas campestris pv. phormiicola]